MRGQNILDGRDRSVEYVFFSITEARLLVIDIVGSLSECAESLRANRDEEVFNAISSQFSDIYYLYEYVWAVRESISRLEDGELILEDRGLSPWDGLMDIVDKAIDAIEEKDLSTVAHIIENDLCPALRDGSVGLQKIQHFLKDHPAA